MDPVDRRLILATGAGLVGVAALSRRAQAGPLEPPPAPVSSTGRTLQQVYDKIARGGDHGTAEARIPVSSLPGSDTAQHVITQPGCYCLTDNITGEPGRCCIEIQADHVELEGDGFTIFGAPGTLSCVRATDSTGRARRCIGIYDLGFSGWQGACCDLSSAHDSLVEECWFDSCVSTDAAGLPGACCTLGPGGVVYDCDVRRCVGGTISVGPGGIIEECAHSDCAGGVPCCSSPGPCVIEDNFATNCDGPAFVVAGRGTVLYNRCVACNGGVDVGPVSIVEENDIEVTAGSTAHGILVRGSRCCVVENFVAGGGGGAGIFVADGGSSSLIEGNHVAGPGGGGGGAGGGLIAVASGVTGCHLARNRVRGNSLSSAFSVAQGNSYGPLCVVAGVGDVSAVPAAAHPEANLVC